MVPEQENENDIGDLSDLQSPLSRRNLSRVKTEKSVASTLCTNEDSSQSCNLASTSKSFKFRPRFADEGLEDLDSQSDFSVEDAGLDTPPAFNGTAEELESAIKVGTEMVREMEDRQEVMASHLLRE